MGPRGTSEGRPYSTGPVILEYEPFPLRREKGKGREGEKKRGSEFPSEGTSWRRQNIKYIFGKGKARKVFCGRGKSSCEHSHGG